MGEIVKVREIVFIEKVQKGGFATLENINKYKLKEK